MAPGEQPAGILTTLDLGGSVPACDDAEMVAVEAEVKVDWAEFVSDGVSAWETMDDAVVMTFDEFVVDMGTDVLVVDDDATRLSGDDVNTQGGDGTVIDDSFALD